VGLLGIPENKKQFKKSRNFESILSNNRKSLVAHRWMHFNKVEKHWILIDDAFHDFTKLSPATTEI
jgi:hypothetical protein